MALTIRDIVEQTNGLEGCVKIQYWEDDEPVVLYEGDDFVELMDEIGDMEITYIYPYDAGRRPAICIEVLEE